MKQRKINTRLVGKDELFKVLALGEVLQIPILFIGVPGIAKTHALLDYASAIDSKDKKSARERSFIIELDEGTKTAEIKGKVNMKEMLENHKYKLDTPITKSEFILINEVDKSNSGIRNAMLSIMAERALFMGTETRNCNWKLFSASCNSIPQDEAGSPFWDRFMVKYQVNRVEITKFASIWKNKNVNITINIPSRDDIDMVQIHPYVINEFMTHTYDVLSDRTLTQLPAITAAVKIIWETDDASAAVKACELLASSKMLQLGQTIQHEDVRQLYNTMNSIIRLSENGQEKSAKQIGMLKNSYTSIMDKIDKLSSELSGTFHADMVEEVEQIMEATVQNGVLGDILKLSDKKSKAIAE